MPALHRQYRDCGRDEAFCVVRFRDRGLVYLTLSGLIILLDQLTKYLTVTYIERGTFGIEVLPFFNLVHVYNYGAAFSFLASMGGWQRWFLSGIALLITLLFVFLLWRTPKVRRLDCIAMALFIGGALGNLIDRLVLGYVVDFLLFYIRTEDSLWAYPAFNVADIAVCVGAGLMVLSAFLRKEGKNEKQGAKVRGET
ncbi:MAG TPA: signal peptidase II [Candidatus Avisuccinivibrio pullicola]|nr:signal peptidase II [Candidatus Avisuccinivibrio pullicola]